MAKPSNCDLVNLYCPESLFECQICMEIFQSPRLLPCQHVFCANCLTAIIKKLTINGSAKGTSFKCPVCRHKYPVDNREGNNFEDHLLKFPESLLLKSLLEYRENHTVQKKDVCVGTSVKKTTSSSSQTECRTDTDLTGLFYVRLCHRFRNVLVSVGSACLTRLCCLWKFRKYMLYFILFTASFTTLMFVYSLLPTVAVPKDIQVFRIYFEQQAFFYLVLLPVICGLSYITFAFLILMSHEIYSSILGALKKVTDIFTTSTTKPYSLKTKMVTWYNFSGENIKLGCVCGAFTFMTFYINIPYLHSVLGIFLDFVTLCFGFTWIIALYCLAVLITVMLAAIFYRAHWIRNLEMKRIRRQHSRRGETRRVYFRR